MRILWRTSTSTPPGSRTSPCTWFAEPPNLQEGRRYRPPFRDFETGTTLPLGRTGRARCIDDLRVVFRSGGGTGLEPETNLLRRNCTTEAIPLVDCALHYLTWRRTLTRLTFGGLPEAMRLPHRA